MKSRLLLAILLLFSYQVIKAQNIEQEINDLINSGDNLTLSRCYAAEKENIHPTLKLMAEGFIYTSFNQPAKACEVFGELATKHQENLGLNGITAVLSLMCENLRYMGKYGEAAGVMKSYLDQTATFNGLDSITRATLGATLALGKFGDEPPVITRPDRDCEVPVIMGEGKLNKHPFVNVMLNGNKVPFLLDTGAEGYATNFVSEGFARKNGIRIIDDSIIVHGITKGFVKLGVADVMQIGDITYKNVRFAIAPGDNVLPVDSIYLDAILGSVFLKAMGEVQFYPKTKKIVFPARQTPLPGTGQNMMLVTGQPVIEAYSGDERLLLLFDTGGGLTLSGSYYERHKEEVQSAGKLKTDGGLGGFGGMKVMEQYILPSFPFRLGDKSLDLKDMSVFVETGQNSVVNGSAGYDLISQFDKFTVNFDKMFVIAE